MSVNEFTIIAQYFARHDSYRTCNVLTVGDDAAIIDVPTGKQLVTSIDTLVDGVHFPKSTSANDIGFKSVAVSLSDLAAMGATPSALLLSLTLPQHNAAWLEAFAEGIFELLQQYEVDLIGGDMSRGPLSISTVAIGMVERGSAIRRSGACVGDGIYVSGTLGDAAYALRYAPSDAALNRPQPCVRLGQALVGIATAAIDISDGLAADLGHLLTASDVGACIAEAQLPLSSRLKTHSNATEIRQFALAGGDDYELCFTAPDDLMLNILAHYPVTKIGSITDTKTLQIIDANGNPVIIRSTGFDHFG